MQTRIFSLIESLTNVVIGFLLAILVQYLVFPHYGFETDFTSHLDIAAIFTLVSIVRSYVLRRVFNWLTS